MDVQPHKSAGNAPAPPPVMTDGRYVPASAIKAAVKGREQEALANIGIDWASGNPHIRCPYPSHVDKNPSWRWDSAKARGFCTCIEKSHSILDVVAARENRDFEGAKMRVAQLLGRDDLIRRRGGDNQGGYQATDAESLLNGPDAYRDDSLPLNYLANRLGVPLDAVPIPSTPMTGLKALGYYDPQPPGSRAKPKAVGTFPCAVFGTVSADGRTHAHRIYLAADGKGKADLGNAQDGRSRPSKKSARVLDDVSRNGCAVIWGDPSQAPHVLLTEGIETGAAVAFAHRDQIVAGEIAVAAGISAAGVDGFQPFPATRQVTVCADRDEADTPDGKPGSRRGEQAARTFGIRNYERVQVSIALPGKGGESVDWLDELCRNGPELVGLAIAFPQGFAPTEDERNQASCEQSREKELKEVAATYPLPAMDSLRLTYRSTSAGKIWIHKQVGWREDPDTGAKVPNFQPVATPFGVTARLRHADQQDAYGLRCIVKDMNGRPREVDFDRAELAKTNASDIRSKLLAAGLLIEADGEEIAVRCLKAANPMREIVVYERRGWHEIAAGADPVFICPGGEILGALEGFELELTSSARMPTDVATRGTMNGWREASEVALSTTGCPHWLLGILAGFVGPLTSLTGLDTCGINFSGLSSSGKSTAQRLAVSAWSTPDIRRPGLAQAARATDNATEALAQMANGTVLSLDELAHVSGKDISKLIYMLAGGVGKQRMSRDATIRQSSNWSTFVILSAEVSIEEKTRVDGGEWSAGKAVRIVDIGVTDVDRRVGAETLRRINQVEHHYGHAGPMFVRAMIEHGLHRRAMDLRNSVDAAARELAGDRADSARVRAAVPLALLLVAGKLAKRFGILPASAPVEDAVGWAWDRFQKSSDSQALDPEAQAIGNLRRNIHERWDVTIKSTAPGPSNRETVGWYDNVAVYIPKERMQEAIGSALPISHIGALLDRLGLLAKRSEPDRHTVKWVPKVGKVCCYALRRDEFGRSDAVFDPSVKEAADD